jgi:MbtH protein
MATPKEFRVVVNHEEQYDLWPVDRRVAGEWRDAGIVGSGPQCLRFIEETWKTMRPADRERLERIVGEK